MTKTANKNSAKAAKTAEAPAAPKIAVGSRFGYREIVKVTSRDVTYINLNGRKGSGNATERKQHTVTLAEFRELVGL